MPDGLWVERVTGKQRSSYRRMTVSEGLVAGLVLLSDAFVVSITGLATYVSYVGSVGALEFDYIIALIISVAHILLWGHRFDLYDFETVVAWPRKMGKFIFVMASAFLVPVGLAFAFKVSADFSRVWVFSTLAASTVIAFAARGAVVHFILKRISMDGVCRTMAVVGAGEQASRLLAHLDHSKTRWHRVVGLFDDRRTSRTGESSSYPLLGDLRDLENYVRRGLVNTIVLTLPWNADRRLATFINKFRELPVTIYLAPDLVGYTYPAITRSFFAKLPIYEVATAPLSGWSAITKEIEDKLLAVLLFVVFGPAMLIIALLIKLDSPGPILFRQKRYGFNNEVIVVHKFRTMYHDRPGEDGVQQARRNDPRVTRIGRFLRRFSLDELPQLLDVLEGRMSLVGPRPHAVEHNKQYAMLICGYEARHRVKPGITGWAQVRGWRGETADLEMMRARIAHDMYYIEKWSIFFDIKILAMTFLFGWFHKNAY